FDLLVSYCNASSTSHPLIKDLSLNLKYSIRTMVAFCRVVFSHAGDRVCYTHFMRELVQEPLGVTPAGWVNWKIYD
ncbi:hypothetical protein BYT27DRAFT_7046269, partial [Phlegmacium glaucopus]